MKILIVEDERSYRAMLFEFLNALDHDVLAVSDALHAVALLNEANNGIDLVLLDLKMPRLGGATLLETFANWQKCHARFLIVSGDTEGGKYLEHPMVVGALQKPFPLSRLEDVLKTVAVQFAATR